MRAAQTDKELPVALLELGFGDAFGGVVGHGGAHYRSVRPIEGLHRGIVHLGGRENIHPLDSRRGGQRRTARDQGHLGTACGQRAGDGVTHLARRVVRDEAYGVDRLDRGPGRDDHPFTGERLFFFVRFGEQPSDEFGDLLRFGHAALAAQAAGQFSLTGFDDSYAACGQCAEILLRGLVGIHVQVHGRGHNHRTACRKVGRQQQVVGHARGHLGQRVGRGRGDHVAVGPFAQRDVGIPGAVLRIEELHQNGALGEGGHRQRGDELFGQRGHHHLYFGAGRLP